MGYGHEVTCMNDNYLQQILSILACNLFLLSLRCNLIKQTTENTFNMKKQTLIRAALVFAGVASGALSSAPAAKAAFFQNGTGLSGPISTVTFDEIILPYLTQVTTQYDSLGVTLSPFGYYFTESNNGLNAVSNFVPNGIAGSAFAMDVNFSAPVAEAALQAIGPYDATATFTAFLGDSPVESASAALGAGTRFFGFNGITFDRISIDTYRSSTGWRSPMILDNIQRAEGTPIPLTSDVPGPLPWLGAGIAFGYSRRLRKRIKINKLPEMAIG